MEFYPYVFAIAYLNRYSIPFFHTILYIAYVLKYIKKYCFIIFYIIFLLKNLYNIFYKVEICEEKL